MKPRSLLIGLAYKGEQHSPLDALIARGYLEEVGIPISRALDARLREILGTFPPSSREGGAWTEGEARDIVHEFLGRRALGLGVGNLEALAERAEEYRRKL